MSSNQTVQVSKVKMALCLVVLGLSILVGVVVMAVARLTRWRWLTERFPLAFHGLVARLFNLKIETIGQRCTSRPVFYAANHISYIDVFALGAHLPGAFVAKSEVAGWPVFGALARLQNTVFLERRAQRAAEQIETLQGHLTRGSNLIVFPEGTSSSGDHVKPFRSSLFAAAGGACVQPVTIAYVAYDGRRMTKNERDHYAWYLPNPSVATPNEPFVSHFVNGLGLGQAGVRIMFHEPVHLDEAFDRKTIAAHCEDSVRRGLDELLGTEAALGATEVASSA